MTLVGRRMVWEEIDLAVYQKGKIDRDYYSNKELSGTITNQSVKPDCKFL